jgi:uncharacterized protein YjbI with pentapeptide repeats
MAEINRQQLILALVAAGPNPRLAGVDLTALDMHRLNLEGAIMRGVVAQACNLQEAILRSVNATGADISLSKMAYADLNAANLTSVNFTATDMTGVRLTGANLTNAILNGANLTNASLTGANVTGVRFDERTTWPDGKKGTQSNPSNYIK